MTTLVICPRCGDQYEEDPHNDSPAMQPVVVEEVCPDCAGAHYPSGDEAP